MVYDYAGRTWKLVLANKTNYLSPGLVRLLRFPVRKRSGPYSYNPGARTGRWGVDEYAINSLTTRNLQENRRNFWVLVREDRLATPRPISLSPPILVLFGTWTKCAWVPGSLFSKFGYYIVFVVYLFMCVLCWECVSYVNFLLCGSTFYITNR